MTTTPVLTVREVAVDHPDAVLLDREVQEHYASRYGSPDASPSTPGEFAPPDGVFVIGYEGDRPVASGGWRVLADERGPRRAEIKRMYVRPTARGRGHARTVLAHLEAAATAARIGMLVLETGTVLPEGVALYRSSGYTDVPPFGFYADSVHSIFLGKPLR